MAKIVFTDEQKDAARDLFKERASLAMVQEKINQMPGFPGVKHITQKQLASLRSSMHLGPEQISGRRRNVIKKSKPKNGGQYTALISGPGIEATVVLSLEQVADILRLAAR